MNEDFKYLLGFSKIEGLDFYSFEKIRNFFHGDLKSAWEAPISVFYSLGLKEGIVQKIDKLKKEIDLEEEWDLVEKLKIEVLSFWDERFPSLLKEIKNPPFVLFVKGKLPPAESLAISVVGTRRPTLYGKKIARSLAFDLAKEGVVIVSGLAYGIDTEAHWGGVEAKGITLAVLGCGLDYIYPPANKMLADAIIQNNGALISEYPPQTPPSPWNFPQRNRIIAGLSLGVVVVEAPLKSGALITAQIAANEGREVFAVPGLVDNENSAGPHFLIKKGAKLVTSSQDIFLEFNISKQENEEKEDLFFSEEEKIILEALKEKELDLEDLAQKTKLKASQLSSLLTMMEIEGKVKNIDGKYTI